MAALRRLRPLLVAALVALPMLGAKGGCGLFTPRVPESPKTARFPASYVDPESTLKTMKLAIEDRTSDGLTAYLGALADSPLTDAQGFHAFFDPVAVQRWQSVAGRLPPDDWPPSREQGFFTYFVHLYQNTYDVTWTVNVNRPNDDILSPTEKVLHRHYLVLSIPASASQIDTIAVGFADLTFLRSSPSRWVVTRWQDIEDPAVYGNPNPKLKSFSTLRLETF
jgi:hypothetical protein